MKILVIGGAGFIGPRVMRRFLERGHEVHCVDVNPRSPTIDGLRDRITVTYGDVTVFSDVLEAMVVSKPDRVLNLAYLLGSTPDGLTGDQDPHFATRLNVVGMDNVFEAARLCDVRRVVYASSLAVYGRQSLYGDRPLTEEDVRLGTGVYSACKIFNEHQADWYNRAYDMQITGVRPANVTGPDKMRGSMDHVLCITQPARGLPVRFPFRDSMRLPIHVEDISEIFARVTLADSTRYSIYNSGGETISMGELADLVKRFLPDAQITFDKEEGGRANSGNYMMDNTRLRQEFEVELAPFPQRVLEIINDIRREEGLPLVQG